MQAWLGDACGLVDAMRSGDLSPADALEASLASVGASSLNAFSFVDADGARERVRTADPSLPFGGVPGASVAVGSTRRTAVTQTRRGFYTSSNRRTFWSTLHR